MAGHSGTNYPERRQPGGDRRSKDRQGKYDRRQNRCAHCRYFTLAAAGESSPEPAGFCQKHQQPFAPETFACPLFEGL